MYKGTLPAGYPDGKVTATLDEVIDGTAYFFGHPITTQYRQVYTLLTTGGSGVTFAGAGIAALALGLLRKESHKPPLQEGRLYALCCYSSVLQLAFAHLRISAAYASAATA